MTPGPARPWALAAAAVLYAALCLHFAYRDLSEPAHNWDMLPYMAVVLHMDGLEPVAAHQRVYAEIARSPMRDMFTGQRDQVAYRLAVARDPEALRQQLPFYQIKPLFNLSNYLLYRLRADLLDCSLWTSILFFLLAALVLFLWLARFLSPPWLLLCSSAALYFTGLFALGGVSSPDTMAAALLALGAFLWRRRGRDIYLLAGALLAQAARPDYAIFGWGLVLGAAFWRREAGRGRALAYLLASLSLYLAVDLHYGGYSWSMFFEHSFLSYHAYPARETASVSLAAYLATMRDEWAGLFAGSRLLSLLLMQVILYLPCRGGMGGERFRNVLWPVLCLDLAIATHFLIHPALLLRYFVGPYLLMLIWCLQAAPELLAPRPESGGA